MDTSKERFIINTNDVFLPRVLPFFLLTVLFSFILVPVVFLNQVVRFLLFVWLIVANLSQMTLKKAHFMALIRLMTFPNAT